MIYSTHLYTWRTFRIGTWIDTGRIPEDNAQEIYIKDNIKAFDAV